LSWRSSLEFFCDCNININNISFFFQIFIHLEGFSSIVWMLLGLHPYGISCSIFIFILFLA
jgi:hypothetical protein